MSKPTALQVALAKLEAELTRGVARENRVCDQIDWSIVEPEHTARERDCQITSPAQSPINAQVSNVEHYAPKSLTVLAYPTLMCMGCTFTKPCTHASTIPNTEMGVCGRCIADGYLDSKGRAAHYAPAERTEITAVQESTGRIVRA